MVRTIHLYSITAWSDYYTGVSSITFENQGTSQTRSFSESSVFVFSCLFNKCTSTSKGGAISCTTDTRLLVESSSFFSCKISSNQGGAIYFYNRNGGECVLHGLCGYDCNTTSTSVSSNGQFAYVLLSDGLSYKNYVNYSSISRSVSQETDIRDPLYLSCGKIRCQSINLSMNRCKYYPGIYCCPTIDSNPDTHSLSYSSITDTVNFGYICVGLSRGSSNFEIKYCNIIRNLQINPNAYGIIYANLNLIIKDSCILDNTVTYYFYAEPSYKITVSNSTVDSTNHYNSFVLTNTITKSFINALDHISTQNCNSEYDSIGILTAIAPPKKKKVFCNTCNCRAVSDFFSLTFVFLVTFIHSNPYGNLNYDSHCF
jgi:predicted outer membrane repeat protein